ncbi:MAG: DHA2 family efflux MFS transporter permease subunit, partial [Terriglobales bacterium]
MNPWLVAVAVMSSAVMEVLDTSVVNVSLPHIAGSLASTVQEATWVLTSYLVANAVILPITGWLGNQFGRKRLLMTVVSGFTISSLLCGLAPNLPFLIICRILQGTTGGGLQPLSQSVLLEEFPPERRGTAMAVWGMGIVVMPILGPIVGGWITDNFSWRWVFFINLPIGILSLVLINLFIFDPAYIGKRALRVDFWGLGLLALWVAALQIMLDKGQEADWFSSQLIVALAIAAGLGFVAFVLRELRAKEPIVHLRLLAYRTYATGVGLVGLLGVVLYGGLVVLPLFLQILLGYNAMTAGALTSPRGVGTMLFMPLAGYLLGRRFDPRKMMTIGMVVAGLALLAFARMTLQVPVSYVVWVGVLQGCGMGFLFVPLTTTTVDPIPLAEMGYATSIYSLTRNIGGSFGIAFATTLQARRAQFHQNILVAHVTSASPGYSQLLARAQALLAQHGMHPANAAHAALGLLYRLVQQQALLASYLDVFRAFGWIFFAGMPFLWIMRRPRAGQRPGAA